MQRCAVCQCHSETHVCAGCRSVLIPPHQPCQVCAKPMTQAASVCGDCRQDPPAFERTLCAAIYQAPVKQWIQQLKFGERMDRARLMAEVLHEQVAETDPSIPIIPMPLHPKRLLQRGFNQAHEVARLLAISGQRTLLDQHLVRTKHTAMQAELTEKQRQANVRAAFAVAQPITAPAVMLLDDVMTTGQTMRSAAQCLIKSGVESVIAVVFARSG